MVKFSYSVSKELFHYENSFLKKKCSIVKEKVYTKTFSTQPLTNLRFCSLTALHFAKTGTKLFTHTFTPVDFQETLSESRGCLYRLAVGCYNDVRTAAVVIVHAPKRVYNPVENHEVRPHGHRASERHLIPLASGDRSDQRAGIPANDVDRLSHWRDEVEASTRLFDFTTLVEGCV